MLQRCCLLLTVLTIRSLLLTLLLMLLLLPLRNIYLHSRTAVRTRQSFRTPGTRAPRSHHRIRGTHRRYLGSDAHHHTHAGTFPAATRCSSVEMARRSPRSNRTRARILPRGRDASPCPKQIHCRRDQSPCRCHRDPRQDHRSLRGQSRSGRSGRSCPSRTRWEPRGQNAPRGA